MPNFFIVPFIHADGCARWEVQSHSAGDCKGVFDSMDDAMVRAAELNGMVRLAWPLRPWRWLAALAGDWLVIVACFALWLAAWRAGWWLALPPLLLLIGSRQHALAVLGHEGAHRAISSQRRVNDALAWAALLPIGGCLPSYRAWHGRHHAFLGTVHDPEHAARAMDARLEPPITRRKLALGLLSVLWGNGVRMIFDLVKRTGPRTLAEAYPLMVFYGTVLCVLAALNALWIAAVWWAAQVTAFWAIFHLRIVTENVGTGGTHRFAPPLWMQLLTHPHRVWRHAEHHDSPGCPFHQLPLYGGRLTFAELLHQLRTRT